MSEAIGLIGLGNLGRPLAVNLLERGYPLAVFNRTASKAEGLAGQGARIAATPADAVPPGGIVISILWDDASVEELVDSDGFLDRLGAGGIHLSMSTVSPAAAKRLAARHAKHGSVYVEAPIFGRPEAAVARGLWIPYAGPAAAKARIEPVLTALGAQGVFDLGEQIGAATTAKLLGNFLIISAGRSMHEAVTMAEAGGVDANAVVAMLTQTLFNAPIYHGFARTMAEKRSVLFSQSDIPRKDLGLFEAAAQSSGASTPIAHLLRELMA